MCVFFFSLGVGGGGGGRNMMVKAVLGTDSTTLWVLIPPATLTVFLALQEKRKQLSQISIMEFSCQGLFSEIELPASNLPCSGKTIRKFLTFLFSGPV